ncbi:hypothetical protein (nucleomorph) [Guillardia theta]|uniref:Uncharacterized protein n=1 Tax=Guillardia theta TaxID=55529 RepID=Q9AR46_GUITH|nr:hypothetical protein GTHECHR2126 [Guillardia theta]XP_001713334.1 hypothetical protein GTHECHR2192 [Guillardia theta]XP_001713486.1 hypothetical protein GTHECHR3152 [Guillardia theta]XP_001713493.1 hypothetical protein GTHECHR3159 [Guillardia theta]XP_001713644.1 hypothetical protein GTHECHR1146 [Guillardia theta]XP_001713651.1 hypothetical protein GTHECHR1153 [Guillardia theta]AAK39788.1 hypothetical protein [Guillardia theta]AAK39795.1 hypothetical protein [Guillardia theta]AAK39939.1 
MKNIKGGKTRAGKPKKNDLTTRYTRPAPIDEPNRGKGCTMHLSLPPPMSKRRSAAKMIPGQGGQWVLRRGTSRDCKPDLPMATSSCAPISKTERLWPRRWAWDTRFLNTS